MNQERVFVSGNEAVALGVRLSRPHVVSAYPITPQTIVVERLSDFVEDQSLKAEFLHVESEHSAMAAAMGVSAVGARAFTATSSQGLLHMAECVHYASGGRFPIVMMNANRSVAVPWSIYGDQRDSLGLLDSGWIQVYVEDAQEALDMTIQAYRIAEDERVMTPFMVNLDGFVLTHTYEPVFVPNQDDVDTYLPKFETTNKMDINEPRSLCFSTTPDDNMEFKYVQHAALLNSVDIIEEVDKSFGDAFGRYYGGMTDSYMTDDAEVAIVTLGSVAGTVRTVIDEMREEGYKVGMMKIRYMRPFPEKELIDLAATTPVLGVLEKNVSFGYEGTVYTNVNSVFTNIENSPKTYNFVAGFGGRDISKADVRQMFMELIENKKEAKRVQFIGMGCEIDV